MKGIGFCFIFILFLLWAIFACAEMKFKEGLVGGRCEYKAYKGRARIVSVVPKEGPAGLKEEYDIKFLFFPDQKIKESYARVEGREFLLLINNMYAPQKAFVEKHEIKAGQFFDCTLQVITKGTCTPTLFEFPFDSDEEGRSK